MKVGDRVSDASGTHGIVVRVEQVAGAGPHVTERIYVDWSVANLPCEACDGTGRIECWNPGGPCPSPRFDECTSCGVCVACNGSGAS